MKKSNRIIIVLATFILISSINLKLSFSQCAINIAPVDSTICIGQFVSFNSISCGTHILNDDFNSGTLNTNWVPNGINPFQFNNPCNYSSTGTSVYDGTPYLWIGDAVSFPRAVTTVPFNVFASCQICFDMVYAFQGNAAPCEGPDLPEEGVHVQYSTDSGTTWTDIQYYPPDNPNCAGSGGYDACMTSWNNYCLSVPAAAVGNNTQFRWYQDLTSGNSYDNWGIDNVNIFQQDTTIDTSATYNWSDNGVLFSNDQNPGIYYPSSGYHEIIATYNDSNSVSHDTVIINVEQYPTIELGNNFSVCADQQVTIYAQSGYDSYIWSTGQTTNYTTFGSIGIDSVNIYVTVTNGNDCSSTDTINVTFENCTEIGNNKYENNILIYPNPAENIFTIELLDNYIENSELKISDLNGKTILNDKILAKKIKINSSEFNSGVYIVIIKNRNSVYRKKLIIQ